MTVFVTMNPLSYQEHNSSMENYPPPTHFEIEENMNNNNSNDDNGNDVVTTKNKWAVISPVIVTAKYQVSESEGVPQGFLKESATVVRLKRQQISNESTAPSLSPSPVTRLSPSRRNNRPHSIQRNRSDAWQQSSLTSSAAPSSRRKRSCSIAFPITIPKTDLSSPIHSHSPPLSRQQDNTFPSFHLSTSSLSPSLDSPLSLSPRNKEHSVTSMNSTPSSTVVSAHFSSDLSSEYEEESPDESGSTGVFYQGPDTRHCFLPNFGYNPRVEDPLRQPYSYESAQKLGQWKQREISSFDQLQDLSSPLRFPLQNVPSHPELCTRPPTMEDYRRLMFGTPLQPQKHKENPCSMSSPSISGVSDDTTSSSFGPTLREKNTSISVSTTNQNVERQLGPLADASQFTTQQQENIRTSVSHVLFPASQSSVWNIRNHNSIIEDNEIGATSLDLFPSSILSSSLDAPLPMSQTDQYRREQSSRAKQPRPTSSLALPFSGRLLTDHPLVLPLRRMHSDMTDPAKITQDDRCWKNSTLNEESSPFSLLPPSSKVHPMTEITELREGLPTQTHVSQKTIELRDSIQMEDQ